MSNASLMLLPSFNHLSQVRMHSSQLPPPYSRDAPPIFVRLFVCFFFLKFFPFALFLCCRCLLFALFLCCRCLLFALLFCVRRLFNFMLYISQIFYFCIKYILDNIISRIYFIIVVLRTHLISARRQLFECFRCSLEENKFSENKIIRNIAKEVKI
jgi:hypothetical protein